MINATIVVGLDITVEIVLHACPQEMLGVSTAGNSDIFNVGAPYQEGIGFVDHQTIHRRRGEIGSELHHQMGIVIKTTQGEGRPCIAGLLHLDFVYLFVYLGFNVAFNTVQVISRRVVRRAEETST